MPRFYPVSETNRISFIMGFSEKRSYARQPK